MTATSFTTEMNDSDKKASLNTIPNNSERNEPCATAAFAHFSNNFIRLINFTFLCILISFFYILIAVFIWGNFSSFLVEEAVKKRSGKSWFKLFADHLPYVDEMERKIHRHSTLFFYGL